MSLINAFSFADFTSDAGEFTSVSSASIVAGAGRRGGPALRITAAGGIADVALPAALTEVFTAFAINAPSSTSPSCCLFLSGATTQVQILINADGSISVQRGSTTLATSAAGLITFGVHNHLQIRVVISDTVGVIQVRLNGSGSPVINLTGIDTNNGAAAVSCNVIRLRGIINAAPQTNFSDFVIWDTSGTVANTWLGDVRVDSYFPNANGDSSQFTGSDGNSTDNYLLVDGAAPNGTDYVQSDTVGHKDLYGFGNLAHTPANIYGVLVTASALKDDAGGRAVRLKAKSGGTEADNGADIALSTSRTRVIGVFETDPNTSAAWTKAAVDAAQFGITVAA